MRYPVQKPLSSRSANPLRRLPLRRRQFVAPSLEETYRNAHGLILMCMYCRRTQRAGVSTDQWDWVEDYAAQMPARVTHGLCKQCLEAAVGLAAAQPHEHNAQQHQPQAEEFLRRKGFVEEQTRP